MQREREPRHPLVQVRMEPLGVGLVLAFSAGRLVKSFLYEVQPLDLGTYAAVVFALAVIGLSASLLPARKAASIEPMQALRED